MPLHPAAAACKFNGYRKTSDDTCEACLPGSNSTGGVNSECNCVDLGVGYAADAVYSDQTGCACDAEEGYAKRSATDPSAPEDTTCTSCADGWFWNTELGACKPCIGGGTSDAGFQNQCTCAEAPAAGGFDSSDPGAYDAYETGLGCPCATDFYKAGDGTCVRCASGGTRSVDDGFNGFARNCTCAAGGNFDDNGYDFLATGTGCGALIVGVCPT